MQLVFRDAICKQLSKVVNTNIAMGKHAMLLVLDCFVNFTCASTEKRSKHKKNSRHKRKKKKQIKLDLPSLEAKNFEA